jgi:hypothetical protein
MYEKIKTILSIIGLPIGIVVCAAFFFGCGWNSFFVNSALADETITWDLINDSEYGGFGRDWIAQSISPTDTFISGIWLMNQTSGSPYEVTIYICDGDYTSSIQDIKDCVSSSYYSETFDLGTDNTFFDCRFSEIVMYDNGTQTIVLNQDTGSSKYSDTTQITGQMSGYNDGDTDYYTNSSYDILLKTYVVEEDIPLDLDEDVIEWYYPTNNLEIVGTDIDEFSDWGFYINLGNATNITDEVLLVINFTDESGATGFDYDFIATTTELMTSFTNRRSDMPDGAYTAYASLYRTNDDCDQTLDNCLLISEMARSSYINFYISDQGATLFDFATTSTDIFATTTSEYSELSEFWQDFWNLAQKTFPLSIVMQLIDYRNQMSIEMQNATSTDIVLADIVHDDYKTGLENISLFDVTWFTQYEWFNKIYTLIQTIVVIFGVTMTLRLFNKTNA